MNTLTSVLAMALVLVSPCTHAKLIGVIAPSQTLTVQRVAALNPDQQGPWTDYLERSHHQRQVDQASLAMERASGGSVPPVPEGGNAEKTMPLNKETSWYASPEALQIADNIVSFQTPAGGWGKNQPRDRPVRMKGQAYVTNNRSKFLAQADFDTPEDDSWSYVGTIDNDATITEIRFLSMVVAVTSAPQASIYRTSLVRGIEYLLAAQFPNGGWPQVWPLQGGYHDAFTLNDNAIVEVTKLLGAASRGYDGLAFLAPPLRERARVAEQRAIAGLLATQLVKDGRKTLWAQQYDALTLTPTSARNYEPAALCSAESAAVLNYFMTLPSPSPEVIEAIEAGIVALRALAIEDKAWRKVSEKEGRLLVEQPGGAMVWARYYDFATLQPVFGDRDKTLHDDVADISLERRNGYSWYSTGPNKSLETYVVWRKRHARSAQ